jgi:septal ring factor EnvC (AmiA/AmiB activator)
VGCRSTTDDGDRFYYAHLSKTLVTTGQRVRAGQPIAAAGNTGNARSWNQDPRSYTAQP